MLRSDHVKHFFVCFIATAICTPFLGVWAWTVGLAVGLGKEVYDWFKYGRTMGWEKFRPLTVGDLIADTLGIIGGILIWWTLL